MSSLGSFSTLEELLKAALIAQGKQPAQIQMAKREDTWVILQCRVVHINRHIIFTLFLSNKYKWKKFTFLLSVFSTQKLYFSKENLNILVIFNVCHFLAILAFTLQNYLAGMWPASPKQLWPFWMTRKCISSLKQFYQRVWMPSGMWSCTLLTMNIIFIAQFYQT